MADRTILKERLAFWQETLEKLQKAYLALLEGGVKSYTIDDRSLTRFDLPSIAAEMEDAEQKVDELTALLAGGRPRRAFGILPRDY